MKTQLKNHTILGTGLLTALLAFGSAYANQPTAYATQNADKQIEQTTQDQTAQKRKAVLQEATAAIRETQNALKALDEGKNQDALSALERATGKLEIILAREPELALAPASVNALTYDVLGTPEAVKELREEAEEALENGHLQEARRLIRDLASETVIRVTNVPLVTYPDAMKLAVRLIDEGNAEAAKMALQTALNTLVITDVIIPLPVIAAEELLQTAETLTEKADRSEQENKRLAGLLEAARTELKFAETLGYGSKKDFKNLYEQLDEIAKKTDGGKSGKGFFTTIKGHLKDTVTSSQPKQADGVNNN